MNKFKTFTTVVEIEFSCTDKHMVRERIIGIPFGDHDCGFRIISVEERVLPPGTDETEKPEYRNFHGCGPFNAS